ncbi:PREDICTED: glutaminyl-peptide cyclotransferase-like [Drosophila arizonae]|uniref:glutaminyl-peptide cyclotransferase n=1 Tax=Drosophila arizonae TaxID=7263 RepID=A0ABM1P6M0_DROAR|nr:PREDICTED: glutaminyl-peptide cyclotransferase-like [Drosophila arizonae]
MSPLNCWILGCCLALLLIQWKRMSLKDDNEYLMETLNKFLVPRWLGSIGHEDVNEFLVEELTRLGFVIIRDDFFNVYAATNVIGVSNMEAKQFLLLSCHYDSKYLEAKESYVAATDAVSCAMLLNIAEELNDFLHQEFAHSADLGLVLAFFDGHESIDGDLDPSPSLLGSNNFVRVETIALNKINLVISFKLIGTADQIYMSKYQRTYALHERLADIEQELRISGDLSKCHQLFHKLKDHNNDIKDDHMCFLEKGLPVMHIVPYTYPEVWLQEADNLDNLHWPTIRNMNLIIKQFVYEYLSNRTLRAY